MKSAVGKSEAERAELDSLLNSEALDRRGNLAKLLCFVCEKYFQGSEDEIKEYEIAVHALGRSKDFDPQIDTIVRVTAHALRKRLEQYYRTQGAEHPIHITLPSGHYVPRFVSKADQEAVKLPVGPMEARQAPGQGSVADLSSPNYSTPPEVEPSSLEGDDGRRKTPAGVGESLPKERPQFPAWAALAILILSLGAFATAGIYLRAHWHVKETPSQSSLPLAAPIQAGNIRALVGNGRTPFVDRAGRTWVSDTYCSGGNTFSVAPRPILGTYDTQLFLGGRSGLFRCAFPVPPGTYEVHLLFAEPTAVKESGRMVDYSLNGGPPTEVDVVDDAGGNNTATEKVFTGVQPEQDSRIHLDFTSNSSYLNAIEIEPSDSTRMLPVRVYAGETSYQDPEGNQWLPNPYVFGGRESRYEVVDAAGIPGGRLYASQWIGHFRYVIPVATGQKYTVKLYFRESYYNSQDGGGGAVGSRVFDVWCNGAVILKNFDILKEAGNGPLIKVFPHIEPTAQGKIELYFVPVVNYPSLNAIEVLPE